MKCLVIGSGGQLGTALQATRPLHIDLTAPPESECNLTDPEHIEWWLSSLKPDVIVNAAAYTAVDAAEQNAATAELVNATAVGRLAEAAAAHGARLTHISTDFVFGGHSGRPYRPDDPTNPLSVYGRTKLSGEKLAQRAAENVLIVRTSWVYSETGNNFALTMLRLMGVRPEIRIVADQIGTPTYVRNLAQAIWGLTERRETGIFHFTDSGVASWYDFAVAIAEEGVAHGLLNGTPALVPIPTSAYPTPAKRPSFSVLDKSKTIAALGGAGQHWRDGLRSMMKRVKRND